MAINRQGVLNLDTINPNIINMKRLIHSTLPDRAMDIEKELKSGVKKPFTNVMKTYLGDVQALGEPPITFIRQIICAVIYPPFVDDPNFPEDVKERARTILDGCKGNSIGAYCLPIGIDIIRSHVAEFIERRDGILSSWENIVLCGGAVDGIRKLLTLFIRDFDGKKTGVLVPSPQFPIYHCFLSEYGLYQVDYYLDESNHWRINIEELQKAIDEAKKVCIPRVLVIINPGNPTGHVLTSKNIEEIIRFAHKENLFIFADEVYQDTIYLENLRFYSFKKILSEMELPYSKIELASFHSTSKGYTNECGLRGGYIEILNMCPKVKAMLYKFVHSTLCSTTVGQACLEATMRPPRKHEPSYKQFNSEIKRLLETLKVCFIYQCHNFYVVSLSLWERARLLVDSLNMFEGIKCNEIQATMYGYPQIELPIKAVEAARELDQSPDVFYTSKLLEEKGVCVLPGEAFGQVPGTYHFRVTLLPVNTMKDMLERWEDFHKEFMNKYR